MNHEKIFRTVGVAAIVLLLFGLGGWYIFLNNQSAAIDSEASSRGFSIGIPAFVGTKGSIAANIESGITGKGMGAREGGDILLGSVPGEEGERITVLTSEREDEAGSPEPQRAPRLSRISASPVAGARFINSSSTRLRYVERSTGHLFDLDPATGEVARKTNTLLPKTYEALIGPFDTIIARTYDTTVRTMAGKVGTTSKEGVAQLMHKDLSLPLTDIVLTDRSADLFMLVDAEEGSRLLRTSWDGKSPKQLATIPAGLFEIAVPSETRIILTERPASGVEGKSLLVASPLEPLLRGPGLMTLPHTTSTAILFSIDDGSLPGLFVSLPSKPVVSLPVSTVVKKCVWAPHEDLIAYCAVPARLRGENFVDRWLRGEVHTEDVWYRIDVPAGKADKFYTLDESAAIDVELPSIDARGEYLAFLNARDKSLWVLRVAK